LDGGVDVHKKRKRYDDGLQELDEKLRDLPSTVYNTEVGALVITVSDMAYDAVENLDPTKFEQNKITNYLNLIQGIYHKIGTVPAPKHDGDHNDKALWRKAPTDDGGDSGPWLFWTNSGWVFSTSLNMSMQMSYDEAGTLAWGSVSDDMPWPMDVHVPYWCDTSFKELTKKTKKNKKHLKELTDCEDAITIQPYTVWADAQLRFMQSQLIEVQQSANQDINRDRDIHREHRDRDSHAPLQAKHGGWTEKTARLVVMYEKREYTEFDLYVNELQQTSPAFSIVLSKHRRH